MSAVTEPMDPARQSAIAGTVLGVGVVVLGACVVVISGSPEIAVKAPRSLIALVGLGLVFCGAAFATVTVFRRLAFALAIPGATLTFLLPMGWFALAPATRECAVRLGGWGGTSASGVLDPASCHWVLVAAAIAALAVVAGMVFAWIKLGRTP